MESPEVVIDWRGRLRRALPQIAIGAIIGTATLALAVHGVDWRAVSRALMNARGSMLLLSLASVAMAISLSVIRWRLLFAPDHRALRWRGLTGAILIGQTANIVVPARVGELARIYLVGNRERISKTRVTATIVVERVADLAVFAVAIALALLGMAMPAWMSRSGSAFVGVAASILVAMVALTFWSEGLLGLLERLALHLPERWASRVVGVAEEALGGLRFLRDWRLGLVIWLLSGAIFFMSVTTNYLVFAALRLPLYAVPALFLTIVLRIGVAPPSLPGRLGLFQYLVVLALAMFGIDRTSALTCSFALYAVAVVPVLVAGVVSLFAIRWTAEPSSADQSPGTGDVR